MATTSITPSSSMPSVYSSSQGSMSSSSSQTKSTPSTGTLALKFTVSHLLQEYDDHFVLTNQVKASFTRNFDRFQGIQDEQNQMLSDLTQRNIEFIRMTRDEIPNKEDMAGEVAQYTKAYNDFKDLCAEVDNFVLQLSFKVDRLGHAPSTHLQGSAALSNNRQQLHAESDARQKAAKKEFLNPAASLRDQMVATNTKLGKKVDILTNIYQSHYGEYLVVKGIKNAVSTISYFWGSAPSTQTPTPTAQPTSTPTPTVQTQPTSTPTPTVQTQTTIHPLSQPITTSTILTQPLPQRTPTPTPTPTPTVQTETTTTQTTTPTTIIPISVILSSPSSSIELSGPDSPLPKSPHSGKTYSEVTRAKPPQGGRGSPILGDGETSMPQKTIGRGGSTPNMRRFENQNKRRESFRGTSGAASSYGPRSQTKE